MLPKRLTLTKTAEERLKREKIKSGAPINFSARECFFISIEKKTHLSFEKEIEFGKIMLEKTVWLGDSQTAVELLIKHIYGSVDETQAAILFSLHVEDGLTHL